MTPPYWEQAKAELSAADAVMARIIADYPQEVLQSRGDAFYTLARSIIGQQVSVKAADSMWNKFEGLFLSPSPQPSPAVGERESWLRERKRAVGQSGEGGVTPRRLLVIQEESLRACGLSRQKIRYLGEIARFFIENDADEAWFAAQSDEEVLKNLTSIVGVGRWTAEMFLIFHLQRPDFLPLDDIGLQRAVEKLYIYVTPSHDGGRPAARSLGEVRMPSYDGMTKKEKYQLIESIAEPWRPWRSVATWYLWRSLDPVPVAY